MLHGDIILPVLHDNGNSKAALMQALDAAYTALYAADDALVLCAPNARNYRDTAHMDAAMAQYAARRALLATLIASIEREINGLDGYTS